MKQYVFSFGEKRASPETIVLLGNKGAQLSEMTAIGLPVPRGFTISTDACTSFYDNGRQWPKGLKQEIKEKIIELEEKTGKKFGDAENTLLVSVRSGSYVSMPGMMDTILNLGLNDSVVEGFAKQTNERAAWDSYRRFMQMFGDVVLGVKHSAFEEILENQKETKGVKFDTELEASDLKEVVQGYKELVKKETGKDFPQGAEEQLELAINAVFDSWNIPRAVSYRRIHKLKDDAGTGVNVQEMVFGNSGNDSGTGVSFTRNPGTGLKEHYGEFLLNAQGEDVVAGIRTPQAVDGLKEVMPQAYEELLGIYKTLENHYKDLQDFEFTIEKGTLFILQTRNGKRTAQAAVKIAVDMFKEGLISKEDAVMKVKASQLNQLLHKQLDEVAKKQHESLAKGLPASPGAAVGKAVFTAEKAAAMIEDNPDESVILVRTETSPEDIEGMHAAQGILTARGGMTSHAAVVARGMGKCCVAGCEDIKVNENEGWFKVGETIVKEGDYISLDGSLGEVFVGQLPVKDPELSADFHELMSWADEFRTMKVRTNADTPYDSEVARKFGAEGIGLCRTEHMFFDGNRIKAVREMILADKKEDREKALNKLLPMQKDDFKGIFKAMDGLPVTIRFLDPPLHEFLPKEEKDLQELSKELNVSLETLKDKLESLSEMNPMLGHRGCRLGITYPEIYAMQARAVFEAALESQEQGIKVYPEIEIPLVGSVQELREMKQVVLNVADELKVKGRLEFKIGTMIELPRACLTADEIAKEAEFFSFGTNDLTQTVFGFSRDDAGRFISDYSNKKVLTEDPFQTIDQAGVGALMKQCVEKGRSVKKDLEIGICGEHGGEAESVEFCHRIGLDYVSCSPYRVPVARLAAAQAALRDKAA